MSIKQELDDWLSQLTANKSVHRVCKDWIKRERSAVFLKPAETTASSYRTHTNKLGGYPIGGPLITCNGTELSLLCQIDLADIKKSGAGIPLGSSGIIQFFVDLMSLPSGREPSDRNRFAVRLCSIDNEAGTKPESSAKILDEAHVELERSLTIPDRDRFYESASRSLFSNRDLINDIIDEFEDELEQITGFHWQIGGWPFPLQMTWMEAQCEMAKRNILGRPISDQQEFVEENALRMQKEWVLLLQVPLDDLSVQSEPLHDDGVLYFWGVKTEVSKGNFENS